MINWKKFPNNVPSEGQEILITDGKDIALVFFERDSFEHKYKLPPRYYTDTDIWRGGNLGAAHLMMEKITHWADWADAKELLPK